MMKHPAFILVSSLLFNCVLMYGQIVAVNQDPLGKQATIVSKTDSCGVLAKDLADGSKAAGLFNVTDSIARKLTVKWSDLGIQGAYIVRDLWRQKDLSVYKEEFSAEVPPHGVVMIGIRKEQ
jgi:alpha-galactosidase